MVQGPVFTPQFFKDNPDLAMRQVPESVVLHGTPKTIRNYNTHPLVNSPTAPTPPTTEELTRFRKIGRFLTTPLSLLASQFSPESAPRAWDIVQQKAEWTFQDVLRDRGLNEKEARWLGFALDIVLDPLNFISFFGLTKFGKAARILSDSKDLKKALPGALKAIPGLDDSTAVARLIDEGVDVTKAEEAARRAHIGRIIGADIERGRNWYDEAAKTQRAALMLNIPFARTLQGIPIVPKEISMMVFAVPTAIRKFFTKGAELIRVPGSKDRTLADAVGGLIRRGSGVPLVKKADYIFRNVDKSRQAMVAMKVLRPMVEDLKKIDFSDWGQAISAVEKRQITDLFDSKMAPLDFLKAGIPEAIVKKPQFVRIMQSLKKNMEEILTNEQLAGLPIQRLADDIDYVSHIVTEEFLQKAGKSNTFSRTPRLITTNHGNFIRRRWRGLTLGDVNKKGREGTLPGYKGIKFNKVLNDNPVAIVAARMHHAIRAITGAQMMRFIGQGLGREIPEAAMVGRIIQLGTARRKSIENLEKAIKSGKGGAIRTAEVALRTAQKTLRDAKALRKVELRKLREAGFVSKSASPHMADFRFSDKNHVLELDRHMSRFTDVESIAEFARYYDAVFNFLKGITLAPFPAYHFRNAVDNMWRNYLAGINPISYYYGRIALRHFDKDLSPAALSKMRNTHITLPSGERVTMEELANEMQLMAVVGHNARDAEFLVNNAEDVVRMLTQNKMDKIKNLVNPRAAENTFIKGGFDIGRHYVENPARAAHYIGRRMQGYTPIDAALSAKKYLFDYADMNDAERQVFRRVFFFWTFMSNNIPFQIEQILRKPGKVGKLFILERSKIIPDILKRDDRRLESKFLSEWTREGAPFFLGRDPDDPDKFRYLMLDGWLSTFDLTKLFDPGNYFINSLSPFLKEPFQQIANFDFFYKKPITSMPNISDTFLVREDFLAVSGPRRIVHVLRNIRAFNDFDKLLKIGAKSDNAAIEIAKRLAFGGSGIQVSETRGAVDLGFRMRDIMREGRREYLRALRRNQPEEANNIMQETIADVIKGFR